LRERGIRVFRPDVEGATTVQTRDGLILVRCYGPSPTSSTAPAVGASTPGALTLQVR